MSIEFPVKCYHHTGISYSYSKKELEKIASFHIHWSVEELVEVIKRTEAYVQEKPINWEGSSQGVLKNKKWRKVKELYFMELSPKLSRTKMGKAEIDKFKKLRSQTGSNSFSKLSLKLDRPWSILHEVFEKEIKPKQPQKSGAGGTSKTGGSDSDSDSDTTVFPVVCYNKLRVSRSFTKADLQEIRKFHSAWKIKELIALIKLTEVYPEGSLIKWKELKGPLKKKGYNACANLLAKELNPEFSTEPLSKKELDELVRIAPSYNYVWQQLCYKFKRPWSMVCTAYRSQVDARGHFGINGSKENDSEDDEEMTPVKEAGAGAGAGSGSKSEVSSSEESEEENSVSESSEEEASDEENEEMPAFQEPSLGAGAGAGAGSGSGSGSGIGKRKVDEDISSQTEERPRKRAKVASEQPDLKLTKKIKLVAHFQLRVIDFKTIAESAKVSTEQVKSFYDEYQGNKKRWDEVARRYSAIKIAKKGE